MTRLVRDKIHDMDNSGEHKYRIANFDEIPQLLADRLREDVERFLAKPCVDEYVDMTDILTQISQYYDVLGDERRWKLIIEYQKAKNDQHGGFREYWVQQPLRPEPPGTPVLIKSGQPEGGQEA